MATLAGVTVASVLMGIGFIAALVLLAARQHRRPRLILASLLVACSAITTSALFHLTPALAHANQWPGAFLMPRVPFSGGAISANLYQRVRSGNITLSELNHVLRSIEQRARAGSGAGANVNLAVAIAEHDLGAPINDRIVHWLIDVMENDPATASNVDGALCAALFASHQIPRADRQRLFEALATLYETASNMQSYRWSSPILVAVEHAVPTNAQWNAVLERMTDYSLQLGQDSVAPGALVPVSIVGMRPGMDSTIPLFRIDFSLDTGGAVDLTRQIHKSITHASRNEELGYVVAPMTPGQYTLTGTLRGRLSQGDVRGSLAWNPTSEYANIPLDEIPSGDVTIVRTATLTVEGSPAPARSLTADPKVDAYIARIVTRDYGTDVEWYDGDRFTDGHEIIDHPPVDMAFEMIWRSGVRERSIGRFLARADTKTRIEFAVPLGDFPTGRVDLILRPCPDLVRHDPSLGTLWNGNEVVLKRTLHR